MDCSLNMVNPVILFNFRVCETWIVLYYSICFEMSTIETKEGKIYLRIRNTCGLLGVLLPYVALFSAYLAEHPSPDWWWSISATYYLSSAMASILVPACIVMICYIGYDRQDDIVTTLSGIFGILLVLFPCKVSWIPDGTPVGFFSIPIEISHIIHTVSSIIFFILLAYNVMFLFTKTNKKEMSKGKKIRNKIYRICGGAMFLFGLSFAVLMMFHIKGYLTIFVEIIMLNLFGIAWLVKGKAFQSIFHYKSE